MQLTVKRLNRQLQKIRKAFDILLKMKSKSRKRMEKLVSAICLLGKSERILSEILDELLKEK